jgi:hypothetical protein
MILLAAWNGATDNPAKNATTASEVKPRVRRSLEAGFGGVAVDAPVSLLLKKNK